MTEEAKKKRDELAKVYIRQNLSMVWWQPTLLMKVSHQAGFDAGYQVAMDEANERIKKLRDALEFYGNGNHFENGVISSKDIEPAEKITGSVIYHYTDPPEKYHIFIGGKTARAALKEDDEKST